MDDKVLVARRGSPELRSGTLVNLGIGLPTFVARFVPAGLGLIFRSENVIAGVLDLPEEGLDTEVLSDNGGGPIGALPGAATFDSAMLSGSIRGGYLDLTVLGGLRGRSLRAARRLVPGELEPGMGGAMDLASGARRVIVAMTHTARGIPEIVHRCSLPLTSERRGDLVITEMAVIESTGDGLV